MAKLTSTIQPGGGSYDVKGNAPSDPLGEPETPGGSGGFRPGGAKRTSSRDAQPGSRHRQAGGSLAENEQSAVDSAPEESSSADEETDGLEEAIGSGDGLVKNTGNAKKTGIRGWSRRKKIGAGAAGGGLFGLLLVLLLSSPAIELVQLSQILSGNDINNETTSSSRLKGLYRYARTGEVGQTRLSHRGSRSVAATRAALIEAGIDITPGTTWGQYAGATIDTSRFQGAQGITDSAAARRAVARDLDIPEDSITLLDSEGTGHRFRIAEGNSRFASALINKSLGKLDNGAISTAMKGRHLKGFLNLPSLLHPIKRLAAGVENRVANRAELKARSRARQAERVPTETPEASAAKTSLRERVGWRGGAVAVLTVTGTACTIRSSASDIITLNKARIVTPAIVESTDAIALGSQIYFGQDFDPEDLAAASESLIDDEGNSVWDAKSLQATWGEKNPMGEDITNENKQAFAGDTTVANIQEVVEFPGIAIACRDDVQLAQAALSILLITGTGGTGAIATNFGRLALTVGAKAVATSVISEILTSRIEAFLADDPFFEVPPTGPLGGNMLAYGARARADTIARASGGVQLSEEETARIDREQQQVRQAEFQTKSFATRMFDLSDYRSVASASMRKIGGSPTKKLAKAASGIGNFGNILSNISSVFTPKALAIESPNYEWNAPRSGIPKAVLDNPDYKDPYVVGDQVAAVLGGSLGEAEAEALKDRARACFGVSMSETSEGWGVTVEEDVSPGSIEYTNAHCDERTPNWDKTMLFVNDSLDMATVACYDGTDETACDDLGFDSSTDAASTTAGAEIVGDPFETSVSVDCAPGTEDLGVHEGYNDGVPVDHRMCAIPGFHSSSEDSTPGSAYYMDGADGNVIVNSRVSGAVLAMFTAAKDETDLDVAATSSFRTAAHQQFLWDEDVAEGRCPGERCGTAEPGTSNHQSGVAIDFAQPPANITYLGGVQGNSSDGCDARATAAGNELWDWLFSSAENYGYKQLAFESWHWDPSPNGCDSGSGGDEHA